MTEYLWIVWLVVFVIALLVEWATSELVSLWFALGAVVTLVLSVIPEVQWWIQLIVFAVLSFAAFIFLRPLLKKLIKNDRVDTNIDEIVGKKGIMTDDYSELHQGEVKVNGVLWTAINTKETESIEKGTKVTVVAVQGNKLVVKVNKED